MFTSFVGLMHLFKLAKVAKYACSLVARTMRRAQQRAHGSVAKFCSFAAARAASMREAANERAMTKELRIVL
jgi:hypothetical protein